MLEVEDGVRVVDRRSQGLWNRGELDDWPIWATHDALLALREAALAGVPLEGLKAT